MEVPDELVRSLLATGVAVLRSEAERCRGCLSGAAADLAPPLRELLAIQATSACGSRPAEAATIKTVTGTAEVAAQLGVSARRVRQLVQAGRLPARRVGRDWVLFDEQEDQ